MRPVVWWKLLRSGGFQVHPSRLPTVIGVTLTTPMNTLMTGVQKIAYWSRLKNDELHGPPVFILGHWRSGTTLLHELMVRDDRYSSPSTYQCFAPHHFLVSEWFFRRFANWMLPGKRPMDNMAAGWDRPQEDEFALMNLGLPSPYRRIAFPSVGGVDLNYLDFDGVSAEAKKSWTSALREFMVAVGVATGRPLVMKSPTHTGRIQELANEFPDAKFVHITRDPRDLFPSTCRLWRGLDEVQSMQRAMGDSDLEEVEDYVIECLQRMYSSFHEGRQNVAESRLIDVRYEDLIADPTSTLQRIYQELHLCDFETVRPTIEEWVQSEHRVYQPNRHDLTAAQESRLREAWSDYFQRYQY